MTINQLSYLITIAETGSLNKAAELLYISQPSLSGAVQELEKELGIIIFRRTGRGVTLTTDGAEFLLYAKQLYGQYEEILEKYGKNGRRKKKFGVSTQHYSFAVNAFVDVIREFDAARYDFTLREEQTHEIIEDVAHMKSELGILYLSEHNREVIERMLAANELVFEGLFCAAPHVFVCADHPLADHASVTLEDLKDYPFLSYEQGSYNSFYYSEELTSTFERRKNIRVRAVRRCSTSLWALTVTRCVRA